MTEARLITQPDYQVRVSPRAKHVSIKVSHLGEVEVVIPQGFDQSKLPAILRKRQEWIAKTIERIHSERQTVKDEADGLPTLIPLRAIGEDWTVTYRPTPEAHIKLITQTNQRLVLQGQVQHDEPCGQLLRRWLGRKAQQCLVPWLRQVSQEIDLPFKTASIRGQKTLWASCSSKHSISLNYKLLLLPPHLVRYVFIHELCHTIHLNHSADFWNLVKEKDPNYKRLDRELHTAWRYVPPWVERSH